MIPKLTAVDNGTIKNLPATRAQRAALQWRAMGVQVLPVYPRSKIPAAYWSHSQQTLLPDDPELLAPLFSGDVGVCVLTGALSGNLMYLDCENAAAMADMADRLQLAGIGLYGQLSGSHKRGGGFFMRCSDGEIANRPVYCAANGETCYTLTDTNGEVITDVELFGQPHVVVTWPSVHRDNDEYRPYPGNTTNEPPVVTHEQLQAIFGNVALTTARKQTRAATQTPPYSKRTAEIIQTGAVDGARWNTLQAVAADLFGCANVGLLPASEAERLLRQAATACSPSYDQTDAQKLAGIIRWARADKTLRPQKRQRATASSVTTAQKAAAWRDVQSWKGKAGSTDLAVFNALIQRCTVDEKAGVFRASLRELEALAGKSRKTIIASLQRLQASGAIIKAGTTKLHANRWRFGEDTDLGHKYTSNLLCHTFSTGVDLTQFEHEQDLLSRGGLGAKGLALYRYLQERGQVQLKNIIQDTGITRETCKRLLDKLIACRLAERVRRGVYCASKRGDLKEAANILNVAGSTARRRELHLQERAWRGIMAVVRRRLTDARPLERQRFQEAWDVAKAGIEAKYRPGRQNAEKSASGSVSKYRVITPSAIAHQKRIIRDKARREGFTPRLVYGAAAAVGD